MPNSRIKDEEQYEALREKGYSKQKSARIANTRNAEKNVVKLGLKKNGPKKSYINKQKTLE